MLKQMEGSKAVAKSVALCRPQVICSYPITPQTHIVEHLGMLVKSGSLTQCEYINVESEFGALSSAIGSSAAGARTYTATASQGLLFMAEAVYNAAGLGLPIVMTIGNRAIGSPINIWNDHSDSMAMMDAGWLQLYVENNQQAVDVHIQAFKLAEAVSLPVMVCMDGFILTHAYEPVDLPDQELVDQFLTPFEPRQQLDPEAPMTIGAMVGPDAFTEVKYLAHQRQMDALSIIPELSSDFERLFGRSSGGLYSDYKANDADLVIVAMGSVIGTLSEVVDEARENGKKVGVISVRSFRPFPKEALKALLSPHRHIIVFEKSLSIGMGGMLWVHINMLGLDARIDSVIGGLGGRPITRETLHRMIARANEDTLEEPHFINLNRDIVDAELARVKASQRSGSTAENLLRDIGVVSASRTG